MKANEESQVESYCDSLECGTGEIWSQEAPKKASFWSILGPGLMVCLADTDGPCLITAAQSGAAYGYSLVLCQLVLIWVLYVAQELTVRLALCTGKGLTELVRETHGKIPAWIACIVLLVACLGALVSEFSAIAQVGALWGCPAWACSLIMVCALSGIVFTGSFRLVEKIGCVLGCCQLIFLIVMFMVKPDWLDVLKGLGEFHFNDNGYVMLVAANVGAVIMPWMLYYQQSACVQRGLSEIDMKYSKLDTAIGSILTQLVMTSMVIVLGATKYLTNPGDIDNLEQILSEAMADSIGYTTAKVLLTLGIIGACLVAAIVVTLGPSWSICEVLGMDSRLDRPIKEAKVFHATYQGMLIISAVLACIPGVGDATWLSVQVEILNSILMPPVIYFIFILATNPAVLPEKYLLKGWYKWLLGVVFTIVSAFCIYAMGVDFYEKAIKKG